MVFSSIIFLVFFLPVFLICYHLAADRYRNGLTLVFSILFYSWGAPQFVFVLLLMTGIDFFIVQKMYQSKPGHRKKVLLTLSICINMGLLFYFKYSNFFIENANFFLQKFGSHDITWTKLILPIGISFFTFETLTYSIDAYRGQIRPLKKLRDYYLYIFLFPKLIAGPIVRFGLIEDQMDRRKISGDDFVGGFFRFILGLGKKVLIANTIGSYADQVFNSDLLTLSSSSAWIGALCYTFQIYFDFSGYSDMALGIGRMIGFRFPENFNNPYTSTSITDFWRRWHMTLGMWMKEYLYIPLGGNRVKSKTRLYFNLWLVFLLSGLWHGASWSFVIWGAFHGLFLVLDRMFLLRFLQAIPKFFSVLITFFLVLTGWVFFRLEDFHSIKLFFNAMYSFNFHIDPELFTTELKAFMIIAIFFSFFILLPKGREIQDKFFHGNFAISKQYISIPLTLGLIILCISYITTSTFNPFIYFRF